MANKKNNTKELNEVIDELMERVKVLEENAKRCKCTHSQELLGDADQSRDETSKCEDMFRQVNEKLEIFEKNFGKF